MNSIEQSIYLELLRASLWERTPDLSVFHGEWSWTALFDAYKNHDQLGIVANTIALLPESVKPNEQEMNVVYQYVGSLLKSHHLLNTRLRDIMPQLGAAGCHPVLLKGQGLFTLYPKTCVRSCGDLDIYVGEENMDKAKAVVNAMATKEEIELATEHGHEYHIDVDGVAIEIHRTPGNTPEIRFMETYLSIVSHSLKPEQYEIVTLPIGCSDKIYIHVPSIEFNVWYIFNHLASHFYNSGIGFRQFCDWLMVIREWNKRFKSLEIPKSRDSEIHRLEELLQGLGLLRAWKVFGGILVYQLGLSMEEFPLWDEKLAKKSQGLIKDEIMGGTRFRPETLVRLGQQGHGFRHIWYNLRYYYYNSRTLYVFSPWVPYTRMLNRLAEGIRHAVTVKNKH